MAINKVVYGADTLVDLTEDTVTEDKVLKGETFHDRSGVSRTGNVNVPVPEDITVVDEFISYNGGHVKSAQMELKPIQDLHGYDHPWVGGAGKNKVPFFTSSTVSNRVWTVGDDGIITITGTSTGNSYKTMNITLPAGTYQLSGGDPNGVTGTGDEYVQVDGVVVARSYGNTNQTFTLSEEKTVTLAVRDFQTAGNSDTHVFKPMICSTSSENPLVYEPYSNICPISGHTQAKLEQRGKNRAIPPENGVFNGTNGAFTSSNTYAYVVADVEPNKLYTVSAEHRGNIGYVLFFKGTLATPVTNFISAISIGDVASYTFRAPEGCTIVVYETGGSSIPIQKDTIGNVQIELGSTATDYEPYQEKEYTINLGGTYYWLRGDVVSGKWYVVGQSVNLGTYTYGSSSDGWFQSTWGLSLAKAVTNSEVANLTCDIFTKQSANVVYARNNNNTISLNDAKLIQGYTTAFAGKTGTEIKTALTGVMLVYELATPIPLDLTPQQVEAFLGENNFSAPLEQQEIIEIIARNIAEFNEVIDDENVSDEFTYSSEKIEDRLEDFVDKDAVEEKSATTEFETINGGLLSSLKVSLSPNQDLHGYDNPWVGGAGKNKFVSAVAKTETQSGITVSTSGDGIYYISGTSSADVNISFPLKQGFTIPTSDAHTLYIKNTFDNVRVALLLYNGNTRIDSWTCTPLDKNNSTYQTMGGQYIDKVIFQVLSGITVNGSIAPMIILKTESDTSYESWENICPISGHTQVEVDVSDGQTTQEQVTVNLGGTYYSGTLDAVSGVFTPDMASEVYDGSADENWYIVPSDPNAYFLIDVPTMTATNWKYLWSESFKTIQSPSGRSTENTIWGQYQQIHIHAPSSIAPSGVTSAGLSEFKTWLSENPQTIVYELATPTPIQLSPTMVKALVGENHLSAPLDGQEITESKYKQIFTFDDVNVQIESIYSEGISHNSVYRGKYLGDHVTDEQWNSIRDGSFRDLYIGDYWTINGINWRIAHFNYWLGTGDVKCNTNHVVIVPYGWVSTFKMNSSDDTTGGYLNSEWYTTNRHFAVENIEADFGASHILSHRNFFSDAVSDGHASHGVWVDSTVDLMNEIMVCGSLIGSYLGRYYEVGCDKIQLALFKYNPPSIRMDVSYWLRGVSTESSFVAMGSFGLLDGFTASQILKIRPVFGIKA